MKPMKYFLPAISLFLFSDFALGQMKLAPEAGVSGVVTPDSTVIVKGTFSADKNPKAVLHHVNGTATETRPLDAKVAEDKSLQVTLPPKMSLGSYYLTLTEDGGSELTVPGSMTVETDAVKLDSVHPGTQYRDRNDLYDFHL